MSDLNVMIIMYLLRTLSLLYILSSSVLLALRFDRVNGDGETISIRLQCGDTKNVTSPNYPGYYENNGMIRWYIEVDPDERIIVTFNDFYTEITDTLRIVEENYPTTVAKYSGSKVISPYVSLGNHLVITFNSDESESKKGFHLSIACLEDIDNTGIHEAFEGLEHTRVLTEPICKDGWQTDVADTICREAGFPGSHTTNFINGIDAASRSDAIVYQCNKLTFRLQDCKRSTSECTAKESCMIKCNVLGKLGCFDLLQYIHLFTRSELKVSQDQCVTHCKNNSATPQYAVHHNGTRCSCISQTDLNITKLSQDHDQCGTNVKSQNGHWATLFNTSFGFCKEPPPLNNGFWNTTLSGYMFGTSITALCNDNYEIMGGDQVLKCGRGTNSSSLDFEWHGTIPSCRERNIGSAEPFTGSVPSVPATSKYTSEINGSDVSTGTWVGVSITVIISIVIIVILVLCFIRRKKVKSRDLNDSWLCLLSDNGDDQQRDCRVTRFLRGVFGRTKPISTASQMGDPEEGEHTVQKMRRDSTQSFPIQA